MLKIFSGKHLTAKEQNPLDKHPQNSLYKLSHYCPESKPQET